MKVVGPCLEPGAVMICRAELSTYLVANLLARLRHCALVCIPTPAAISFEGEARDAVAVGAVRISSPAFRVNVGWITGVRRACVLSHRLPSSGHQREAVVDARPMLNRVAVRSSFAGSLAVRY